MKKIKQQVARYGLAILAAVAALVLRKLLNPLLGSTNPYHTAWAAVVVSAWYCGPGPAIATVAITLAGIWYWFLPPSSWGMESREQIFGVAGFLALSAVIIWLGESSRRTMVKREKAEAELRKAHDVLESRARERTSALERKTAELTEQAEMLDLANDAIFVRTVADTISYWNEGAQRLYGWTKEEALGHSPHELLHTEFPSPQEEIMKRDTWEGELLHTKRDGTQITVASRWRTLRDHNGKTLGWLEINSDITSRKRAEEAARSLSGRILSLQDAERRRIARDLHDSLGQYLAAVKMNLECLPVANDEQSKIAADCSEILNRCLAETRTISHLLHPPLLDDAGLASAAGWYVDEFSRRSGVTVSFEVIPERRRLDAEIEIALFRVIQEALTNVHRHSGASTVDIRVTLDEKRVRLEIRDNGHGIPQDKLSRLVEGTPQTGVGLAGMRERLRELNGSMEIQSNASGTTLIVVTPLPSKATTESANLVA